VSFNSFNDIQGNILKKMNQSFTNTATPALRKVYLPLPCSVSYTCGLVEGD
jgi:hypothetical protein